MVTFHCFRSNTEKPLVCIRRICFSTVDLPDSPAPIPVSIHYIVVTCSLVSCVPSKSNFTSLANRFWSSFNCFSISLLLFASGSSLLLLLLLLLLLPSPKHMILEKAIRGSVALLSLMLRTNSCTQVDVLREKVGSEAG